ncbi:MAG: AAA family ATPase, partial [Chloroflexi bacterium]|nr:AAA family ATPase [Chloroflexota bacterium]
GLMTGNTLRDQFFARRQAVEVKRCKEENPKKALAFSLAGSYLRTISDEFIAGKTPCRAVVVDSLTTLAENCMRLVLSNKGKLGGQPTQPEWGLRDLEMVSFFTTLYSLPCVVVLIAHLQGVDEDGQLTYKIALQGKALPPMLLPKFDELWLARVERAGAGKTIYNVHTQGSTLFPTRSRAGIPTPFDMARGLPSVLESLGHSWK